MHPTSTLMNPEDQEPVSAEAVMISAPSSVGGSSLTPPSTPGGAVQEPQPPDLMSAPLLGNPMASGSNPGAAAPTGSTLAGVKMTKKNEKITFCSMIFAY